jgi:ABC-type branched-subunit amino acid transport system substrate-binding protein
MGFQPGAAIGRVITYARSRGVDRFAALVPQGAYGQRAQLAFVKAVNDAGGRSTAVVSYARDPAKLKAELKAQKAAGIAVVRDSVGAGDDSFETLGRNL